MLSGHAFCWYMRSIRFYKELCGTFFFFWLLSGYLLGGSVTRDALTSGCQGKAIIIIKMVLWKCNWQQCDNKSY